MARDRTISRGLEDRRLLRAHAAELSARYESALSPVERYFALAFPAGARVLDVGAGSAARSRPDLTELMQPFAGQGDHGGLTAWHLAWSSGKLPADTVKLEQAALRAIASAVRSGPVTHSGGALAGGRVFNYESRFKAVIMSADLEGTVPPGPLDRRRSGGAMGRPHGASRTGKGFGWAMAAAAVLARPEPKRATDMARTVYMNAGVGHCAWTGRPLSERRFDVDHVIPFSLWGNNDLWNLLPAHPEVNGQ